MWLEIVNRDWNRRETLWERRALSKQSELHQAWPTRWTSYFRFQPFPGKYSERQCGLAAIIKCPGNPKDRTCLGILEIEKHVSRLINIWILRLKTSQMPQMSIFTCTDAQFPQNKSPTAKLQKWADILSLSVGKNPIKKGALACSRTKLDNVKVELQTWKSARKACMSNFWSF